MCTYEEIYWQKTLQGISEFVFCDSANTNRKCELKYLTQQPGRLYNKYDLKESPRTCQPQPELCHIRIMPLMNNSYIS